MLTRGVAPWNLVGGSTTHASVSGDAFVATNPKGTFGSSGGTDLRYAPSGLIPARGVALTYEAFLDPGWCWGTTSFGGKLPGLLFGSPSASGGTGGDWIPNGGSCRPMWGEGGVLCAYVYYNKATNTPASRASFAEQAPEFASIAKASGTAGQRLWESTNAFSKPMPIGQWFTVTVTVIMNTPGKQDGVLSLSLNGETRTYSKMFWRGTADQLIDYAVLSVWHGGSDSGWGCPADVQAQFKNFSIQTTA